MPSRPDPAQRPPAVIAALSGAFAGVGATGALLVLSDREPGWMAVIAGVSAAGSLVAAFPVRAGHAWARVVLFVFALLGVLTAHAVAVVLSAPLDVVVGTALALVWACVIGLLLRADVREFCAGPAAGHERLTG